MSLVGLILVLAVVGLVLWLVRTYIPMDPMFANVITVIVLIAIIVWLLDAVGLLGGRPLRISHAVDPPFLTVAT